MLGIEYAFMQSIAETYDILRKVGGMTPPQVWTDAAHARVEPERLCKWVEL